MFPCCSVFLVFFWSLASVPFLVHPSYTSVKLIGSPESAKDHMIQKSRFFLDLLLYFYIDLEYICI